MTAKTFSTSDLNKHLGDVLDAASRGPVEITRHGKARFVITSADHFAKLTHNADTRRAYLTKDLPTDILNAMAASNADIDEPAREE